ncbi:MAG: hypothetical protein AB7N80_09905 [Bdellovibrionales bacterium]
MNYQLKVEFKSLLFYLCYSILVLLATTALAAPIPATSSSSLIGADLGLFISEYGFSIHAGGTSWIHTSPPKDMPALTTLYRSPNLTHGVQPSLTVRVDQLKEALPLNKYAKQWMKDYPRLGFEVLASKPLRIGKEIAYLVDILNRDAGKQLRQVVFVKERTAVVLTCRDHRDNFDQTVRTCNEIIKNFKWR